MQKITPVIKDYAWGSRESLARLGGRPYPTDEPEAELWVGAHEAGPAMLVDEDGTCLDAHISTDPEGHLGSETTEKFGERLPFLLKILAAETALSIQAHPDADRAKTAPEGVYNDSWPKPEAWIPLTDCEAFAGSLPFDEAAKFLRALHVPALDSIIDEARAAKRPEHALLSGILAADAETLVPSVVKALKASSFDGEQGHAVATVLGVHEDFPGDIGVIVLLTMKHHVMVPGKSYFIAAGVLHSFVKGTTVEILANSDNVVRAGLTPKKIDVNELLEIVDTNAVVEAETPEIDGKVWRYASHVPHFALLEVRPDGEPIAVPSAGSPSLLMVLDGEAEVRCADDVIRLGPLECAWWAARDPEASVTGTLGTRVFVATLND